MRIFNKFRNRDDYDPVEEAWKSQNLKKMVKALKWKPKKPLNRHFLLLYIIQNAFSRRDESEKMVRLCQETAVIHLSEMHLYLPILKAQFGELPNIQTHHYLATLLSEENHFDAAIQVCLQAMAMGIPPGKGGSYQTRIKAFESAKVHLND